MKLLGLAIDFLGIGWGVLTGFIMVVSIWAVYLGYTVNMRFDRFGELKIEIWLFLIMWLLTLIAVVRAARRIREK